jgi:hypothetical protein
VNAADTNAGAVIDRLTLHGTIRAVHESREGNPSPVLL